MADRGALWQWLIDALEAQLPAALLIIADTSGSSPAKIGAKMALTQQHSFGTIGGGPVEQQMLHTARNMLLSGGGKAKIFHLAHHASTTMQRSGAICGGEQTVLVYPCSPEDHSVFTQLLDACQSRTPLNLTLSTHGLTLSQASHILPIAQFSDGDSWQYQETLGQSNRAFIIGGGHVSLALSKVLDWLDFDVTVMDERESLETMQNNPYARQKCTVPYRNIAEHVQDGPHVFVFVMTHNHSNDELVLRQLLPKRFSYIGLLGSQNKITQLQSNLAKALTLEQLQQLRAPMGLPIKSHSPEEIAISIAAELIQMNVCQH